VTDVLESILPVVAAPRHVELDRARLDDVAGWLAYEELPVPATFMPFPFELARDEIVDFVLVACTVNFAFTSFESRERWEIVESGRAYADSDGLHFALYRALREGVPVLDGAYLSQVDADVLRGLLRGGTSELQLLDTRAELLRDVGRVLVERFDGRFHRWLATTSPHLYDGGEGYLERLTRDFPRFDDVAEHDGGVVRFWKLAQLSAWILEVSLRQQGGLGVDDLHRLTALADYVVPAALEVLGILRYDDELAAAIAEGRLVEAGSPWEVELRAQTINAVELLTQAVNEHRPPELAVIAPQIDARLWLPFHRSHRPHHLTPTIYY
jgi:hypothetical protein